MWARVPLRLRLTLVFGVAMATVLVGLGTFTYLRLQSDLLESVDLGLRPRAQAVANVVGRTPDLSLGESSGALIDPDEAFAQVIGPTGEVVGASSAVRDLSLLSNDEARALSEPTFITRRLPGFDDPVRLLAMPLEPAAGRVVLVVGSTLGDVNDALQRLVVVLVTVGPVALVLTVAGGWLLAGAALRPVELMRREATAISASEPGRRLPVPVTGDELAHLASTLNSMLDRLQEAMNREHRFVDEASHELRMPLATLRTELDLALARPRSVPELEAALTSVREDVDHLQRLAEDLLVLARARGGQIPIRRVATALDELAKRGVASIAGRARAAGVIVEVDTSHEVVDVDPERILQALRNLLENAIRHTPRGGRILVQGGRSGGRVRLAVEDSGPGFPPELLLDAFKPFARGSTDADHHGGTGLGLAIVRAVVEAHGGSAMAENGPDGARVMMELPA